MKRLAIITTHPIQYNAPFFRTLAQSDKLSVKVFYTWDKGSGQKHDPGFGQQISWDIPLLEGYDYTFVKNTSKNPGSHHFRGIQNPSLINEIKAYQPDAILIYGWSFQSHLRAMRYFKGKIPVWFRGDSTLLDYDYRSIKDVFREREKGKGRRQKAEDRKQKIKTIEVLAEPSNKKQVSFEFFLKSPIGGFRGPLTSFLKFSLRRLFLTWVYRHIDKAFYVGTNNKNYYVAHGLKENQLVWMPHAVNNEFFQKDEEKVEVEAKKWRQRLGIKEDDFIVLFAGKFEPKKNPELLVKAIIEINEETKYNDRIQHRVTMEVQTSNHSNKFDTLPPSQNEAFVTPSLSGKVGRGLHLIMVGSGILESKLKELAADKPYIYFVPFQNQTKMPVVYRLGDVFCLSSQSETWGLAVNEAMACSRSVLVSDKVGCAVDLIIDNKTGFIFQHNSMDDLKNAIEKSLVTKSPNQHSKEFIQNWSYNPKQMVSQLNLT